VSDEVCVSAQVMMWSCGVMSRVCRCGGFREEHNLQANEETVWRGE
jgi:hypothetical protein